MELGVLIVQFVQRFLKRTKDALPAIFLTFLFLGYNLAVINGINERFGIGDALAVYYFYFIFSVLLPNSPKRTNLFLIIGGVILSLFISMIEWVITGSIAHGTYPVLMGVYFCIGVILSVYSAVGGRSDMTQKIIFRIALSFVVVIVFFAIFLFEKKGSHFVLATNLFFVISVIDYWWRTSKSSSESSLFISSLVFSSGWVVEPDNLDDYILTPQQRIVVQELLKGTPPKNIANKLNIHPNTVRKHLSDIYDRTGCEGSMQLFLIKFSHRRESEKK